MRNLKSIHVLGFNKNCSMVHDINSVCWKSYMWSHVELLHSILKR